MRVAEALFWIGFVAHASGIWFVAGWQWCILVTGVELMLLGLRGMHDS